MSNSYKRERGSSGFSKVPVRFYVIASKIQNMLLFYAITGLSLCFHTGHSQVRYYNFSERISAYSSISGTTAIAAPWDNASAIDLPIGFTFNYDGTNYTTFSVLSNGFITFGTTVPNDALGYNPISVNGVGFSGAISALTMDIRDNGSPITYTTTGSSPFRTLIIQWANVRRIGQSGNFNFQIQLKESSNLIQIVYGSCSPNGSTPLYAEVGLRGASNSDYNNRIQNTNAVWYGSTNSGTSNTDTCITQDNSYPNNGLTYTWYPPDYTTASCNPSSDFSTYYISSFRITGSIVEASNNSGFTSGGYANYTGRTPAQQIPGSDINISIAVASGPVPFPTQYIKAWVDWNKNGDFTDTGDTVFSSSAAVNSTTFGFVIPAGTNPGNYRLRIRASLFSNPSPCGNQINGETEDYIIKVIPDCPAKITNAPTVTICGAGPVTLSVTGSPSASSYAWYTTETGGSPIPDATTATYTTPVLSTTTTYYVTALNGNCESLTRTPIIAQIKPVPNITISPTTLEICGDKDFLQISAAGSTEIVELLNEDFEGSGLGSFIKSGNGNSVTEWQQKTSVYTTVTTAWKPAINSGGIGNKFAFTTSDVVGNGKNLIMTTSNSFSTIDFIDLTLTFRHYFSFYDGGETANIDISTDNGASWTTVRTFSSNQGYPSKFTAVSIPLNGYINVANLKIRFRYAANYSDGWAIDDIVLFGTRPLTSNFTWTGAIINAFIDPNGTIPYISQPTNVVYIKPTDSQLEVNSWSFTANVALTNGCTASQFLTVNNKSKVWQGYTGNWNDPYNWLPLGTPTAANCVIIKPAGSYSTITGTNFEAQSKSVTIKPNGHLEIPDGNSIRVVNTINVESDGIFNVGNNSGIIQEDDVPNSGIVTIRRITQPMSRYDYTYWNSPVTLNSGYTLAMLSPNTLSDKYMRWQPTINGGNGNWITLNPATPMDPTMGYIVRAPQTFDPNPANKINYIATFSGTPNNGDILIPIAVGTDANVGGNVTANDDQWNLIGNPYPSAIDVLSFLNDLDNSSLLDGTIYLWTHNSPTSEANPNPFYGTFTYNYTEADYATVNRFGATATATTGGSYPSRFIASCQSFFVKGLANGNVKFANYMRVSSRNDNFMKVAHHPQTTLKSQPQDAPAPTGHRIWLNLANESGAFSQILVGYHSDASMAFDRGLDGELFGGNHVTFYSTIPDKHLTIQARPLPFNDQDQIPLGYRATAHDIYQIGIDHVDGIFNTHKIYLEDKLLDSIHDLRITPYTFISEAGVYNNRFVLRFNSNSLNTSEFSQESIIKIIRGEELTISSANKKIKDIVIYDLIGRKIGQYYNVSANEVVLKNTKKTFGILLLKITLDDNSILHRKIIF